MLWVVWLNPVKRKNIMDGIEESNYGFFCTYHGIVKQLQIVMHIAIYFSEAFKSPDIVDMKGLLIVFTLSTFLNVVIAFLNVGIIYLSVKNELGLKALVVNEFFIFASSSLILISTSLKEFIYSGKKEMSKFEIAILPFLILLQLTICIPLLIRYYKCKKLTYYVCSSPISRQPSELQKSIEMKVLKESKPNKRGENSELLQVSPELETYDLTQQRASENVDLCQNLSPSVTKYNSDSSFNDSSMMGNCASNYYEQICDCGFELKKIINIQQNDSENLSQSEESNLLNHGLELIVSPISKTEGNDPECKTSDVLLSETGPDDPSSEPENSVDNYSLNRVESIDENKLLTNHLEISFQEETLNKLRESLKPMKRPNYFRRKFCKIWREKM